MDWNTYEEVTKNIYEVLGKKAGVTIVGWGNNFKVKGRSGVEHQIDVLTSHSDGIHSYFTDIECKYWDQKINKDTVMKVKSIVDDCLYFNKGVVVSKEGFTEDAIAYAKSVNVGLVILREPTKDDWEGRIKTIELQMHIFKPEIIKYEQVVSEVFKDLDQKQVNTDEYVYKFQDGTIKSIKNIIDDFLKKLSIGKTEIEVTDDIKFPEDTFLQDSEGNNIARVESVKITGKLISSTYTTEIHGEDRVWLMMKSIFEKKTYIISKNGEIKDVS